MGGSVSIFNNSYCTITLVLKILGVSYYWENQLAPGDWMNRTDVGHVWFDIETFPWYGNDNSGVDLNPYSAPYLYIDSNGTEFTMLGRLGIRGSYDFLLGRSPPICFDWPNATALEKALAGNSYTYDSSSTGIGNHHYHNTITGYKAPFYTTRAAWYIEKDNVWVVYGGPHCEMRSDFYIEDGVKHDYRYQIFDDSVGFKPLNIAKIPV